MKELDYVVGAWAKENLSKMNYDECLQFHKEVLEIETPTLH